VFNVFGIDNETSVKQLLKPKPKTQYWVSGWFLELITTVLKTSKYPDPIYYYQKIKIPSSVI